MIVTSALCQGPGGGSEGEGGIVEIVWVLQPLLTKIDVIDTVIHVVPEPGGGNQTITYTRNQGASNKGWFKNGIPMPNGQHPGEPITSNVSCSWEVQGHYEYTYIWTGPGPVPAKASLTVVATSEAHFAEGLVFTIGSGEATNGFGDAAMNTLSGICTTQVVSSGAHFVEVDVDQIQGKFTFKSETMRAFAESQGVSSSAYAAIHVTPQIDQRSISLVRYPSYLPQKNGNMINRTVSHLYTSGHESYTYEEAVPVLSQPEPFSYGRHFVQKFKFGVPYLLIETGQNTNELNYDYDINVTANSTNMGSIQSPDWFQLIPPGGGATLSGHIPNLELPWIATGVKPKDWLFVERNIDGDIVNLTVTAKSSGQSVNSVLNYVWADGVQGVAEAHIQLMNGLVPEFESQQWDEPGAAWISATGWVPGTDPDSSAEGSEFNASNWIEASGATLELFATDDPRVTVVALLLGVAGNVGQALETTEKVFGRDQGSIKFWPDPAVCGGVSWTDFWAGPAEPRPRGLFDWMVQGKPALHRKAIVFQIFDERGFKEQLPTVLTRRTALMGGNHRTVEWYKTYGQAPPAWWLAE